MGIPNNLIWNQEETPLVSMIARSERDLLGLLDAKLNGFKNEYKLKTIDPFCDGNSTKRIAFILREIINQIILI